MDARLEQIFARWCALRVGRWWHYHSTVFKWLGTRGSAAHQSAQWARVAPLSQERAEAAVPPWSRAGRWAEAAAHWAAAMAATAPEDAPKIAAAAAAASVRAQCAAWECGRLVDVPGYQWGVGPWGAQDLGAAQAFEQGAQAEIRDRINALSSLLLEHGLEALRTQEAEDDPWLTREVWEVVMERDVEVVAPMRDQGETYHVEIVKTVRTVPDHDVVREWCDWMIAAKKADAAPVPEEAAVGAGEGGGDVAPSP